VSPHLVVLFVLLFFLVPFSSACFIASCGISPGVPLLADPHKNRADVRWFSNERKYISLFPITDDKELLLPSWLDDTSDPHPSAKGEQQRKQLLDTVRSMMARGEISAEPEKELSGGRKQVLPGGMGGEAGPRIGGKGDRSTGRQGKGRKGAGGSGSLGKQVGEDAVGTEKVEEDEDDFFESN